jgi:hypothetical protein
MSAASWSWSRSALLVAGAAAALIWALGLDWFQFAYLTLFGANDEHPLELDGPLGLPLDWWDDLPAVAGVLGVVAIAAAFLRSRVVVVVLALGTAYLLAWLIDPPHVFDREGASGTSYLWPAYVATAAIAVATVLSAVRAPARSAGSSRRGGRASPPPRRG